MLVSVIEKLGSEYLVLSDNQRYAFVANGFEGLVIVDFESKNNPIIISSLVLDGWANSLFTV